MEKPSTHGTRPTLALVVALALSLVEVARGQAAPLTDAERTLLAVAGVDPLELAHAADRLGDGRVVELLAHPSLGRQERLSLVRVAPWLDAPEATLPALIASLRSHDVELAPPAMYSLTLIVDGLTRGDFDARESDPSLLDEARQALGELAEDTSLRVDVRAAAVRARLRVEALLAAGNE